MKPPHSSPAVQAVLGVTESSGSSLPASPGGSPHSPAVAGSPVLGPPIWPSSSQKYKPPPLWQHPSRTSSFQAKGKRKCLLNSTGRPQSVLHRRGRGQEPMKRHGDWGHRPRTRLRAAGRSHPTPLSRASSRSPRWRLINLRATLAKTQPPFPNCTAFQVFVQPGGSSRCEPQTHSGLHPIPRFTRSLDELGRAGAVRAGGSAAHPQGPSPRVSFHLLLSQLSCPRATYNRLLRGGQGWGAEHLPVGGGGCSSGRDPPLSRPEDSEGGPRAEPRARGDLPAPHPSASGRPGVRASVSAAAAAAAISPRRVPAAPQPTPPRARRPGPPPVSPARSLSVGAAPA